VDNDDGQTMRLGRIFPGGTSPSSDEVAVATVILGGLGVLYLIRKGVKGLGPVELVGSTLSAIEFAGYLVVVGGTIRVITTRYPENPLARALSFVY
jgi:hypothetical protein